MYISKTRGLLYRLARMLGWVQIFTDAFEGHSDKSAKRLINKLIGRKINSKIWLR